MYTALHLALELRADTPQEIFDVLWFMTGDLAQEPGTPSHPLFQTDRWQFMLRCDSYYHAAQAHSSIVIDEPAQAAYLTVISSFKNYDGEIEKFVDWISPYVHPANPRWIGYEWYEEAEEPTSLYRREVLPSNR